eukprot:TRINITY_DN56861_c0_g1_i1.p1 TRINITY_DN56861_c0_g1~~TRINITY_DN56861_c0_g1_i1.p1  ORF type:complete len:466 (+),score=89.15 TRINITY_DN56861_c0_g1_i1:43-1440(+)
MAWTDQWNQALKDIRTDSYESSAEKLRQLTKTGLLKFTDIKNAPERFFEAHRHVVNAAPLGSGFWVRFTVHYNLCFGSVLAVGSDEQIAKLDDIQKRGLLGCFALTEKLAGVNSGMIVQTTVEWDDAAQEFVIDSPTEGSHKNWISAGLCADLALVVADLKVAGKSYGPHALLVEMRKDGKLVPGIELGDMGVKTVGNDLDNAWIAFHKFRAPHSALLSRYGEVKPGNGGTYISKAKGFTNMMMIGQRLFTGRVAVAQCALAYTRRLFECTRKYSDAKMCWGPKGNTSLTQVPQLSGLYQRAEKKLQRLDAFVGECQRLLSVHLRNGTVPPVPLQDAIACAKIAASETSIDLTFRLTQDVGSFAMMTETGFGTTHFLQACKFAEGDSRILMQKLARDRLKVTKPVGSEKEQALVARLTQAAGQGSAAWDEHFEEVYELAWTMVTRIIDEYTPGSDLGVPAGISKL